jgi:siroheme synthase-like protein
MSELFPIFLKLHASPVLVVGGGCVAWGKVQSLLPCGSRLTVIAPGARREIAALAEEGRLRLERRVFREDDVEGQGLVFAATGQPDVNRKVVEAAARRGILANAVDDPDLCRFYCAAVLRRGPVRVAVGTSGGFPGLARAFREQLERLIPEESGDGGQTLAKLRAAARAAPLAAPRRKQALDELVTWFTQEYLTPAGKESP